MNRQERDALAQIRTRRALADMLDKFMTADHEKYAEQCDALKMAILTMTVLDESLKESVTTTSYYKRQNSVLKFENKKQENQIRTLTEGLDVF